LLRIRFEQARFAALHCRRHISLAAGRFHHFALMSRSPYCIAWHRTKPADCHPSIVLQTNVLPHIASSDVVFDPLLQKQTGCLPCARQREAIAIAMSHAIVS